MLWTIVSGSQRDGFLDLAAIGTVQAIEAALALTPRVTIGNHFADQRQLAVGGVEGIAGGQGRDHAGGDMGHQVQADQIHQAEDAGLGDTHGLADDSVGFLDLQPAVQGFDHRNLDPIDA